MPRVENLGINVSDWHHRTGEGSSTHDVCQKCHRTLQQYPHAFDDMLQPYNHGEPQGDEGWAGDMEHPPYEDEPCRCACCNVVLQEADNHAE